MTVNIEQWENEIYPHITGVPYPAILDAVRDSAREFCVQTQLWTYTLERIDVVADANEIAVTIPALQYGELIKIDSVKYKPDGEDDDQFRNLVAISENQMDLNDSVSPAWKFQTSPTPSKYWMEPDDDSKLYLNKIPTEDSTSGLLLRVFLKPALTTDVLPDFIYYKHKDAITDGALSELLNKKAMPWYDLQDSGVRGMLFANAWSDAKNLKTTGLTNRKLSVRMRDFV